MTTKHIFENVCLDFSPILAEPSIRKMLTVVKKQAKTEEAKRRTDFAHYKEYGDDEWSPTYFGLFVEWFAEHYLNHFGHKYNIHRVQMLNHEESSEQDWGVDGVGFTMKERKHSNIRSIFSKSGSPVYIQVKGTLNSQKEFKANDGSRLTNFISHAVTSAIVEGQAYQARCILFTTGKGIYYTLDKMTNGIIEVISINQIKKMTDGNVQFLDVLRKQVGIEPYPMSPGTLDPEAEYHFNNVDLSV